MLLLNATQIKLKSLRITASQELAEADASGSSSSTAAAETGSKAKTLTVYGELPFTAAKQLSQLWQLAEATQADARVIYRISNHTAEALGIKQVRFASKIEAVEQQDKRKWVISFNLTEYHSVPEKKEQRQPDLHASQQGTDGQSQTAAVNPEDNVPPDTQVPLTGFAGFLKSVDSALA